MTKEEYCRCRVCGYLEQGEFWVDGEDPTYCICPSCGCEAGNHDFTLEETREYRQKWIDGGMKWVYPDPACRPIPPNWNPKEQMKYIPPNWL
ncbi:MAG: hypothetical protein IPK79_08340 [Vampirovibrionales bacterium]|nr:hypothetical protein [Vampirovibrionales bacterium]